MEISGISISEGVAIEKVLILSRKKIKLEKRKIQSIKEEINKFDFAVKKTVQELKEYKKYTEKNLGKNQAQIFEAHIEIAKDLQILNEVKSLIKTKKISAELAYESICKKYVKLLMSSKESFFQDRANDINDVSFRLLSNLLGEKNPIEIKLNKNVIVASEELLPSDIVFLNQPKVKGFITIKGGRNSHVAIMARSLSIPAISGVDCYLEELDQEHKVILDGFKGKIILEPSKNLIKEYEYKIEFNKKKKKDLEKYINIEPKTIDGRRISLNMNIGNSLDIKKINPNSTDGIGLFRTEMLLFDKNEELDEKKQIEIYSNILKKMRNKRVVIRTFDFGSDKNPFFVKKEQNPSLGLRGIRFSLKNIDNFKMQLRALIKSNVYENLSILFPMITTLEELYKSKKIFYDVCKKLNYSEKKIKIGVMVEVPSVALNIKKFLKEVDFISIGTNDLLQYLYASDRLNQDLEYLYKPFDPLVLNLINDIKNEASNHSVETTICGEMASDLKSLLLLIGLGLKSFSVNESIYLKIKSILRMVKFEDLESIAKNALKSENEEHVKIMIENYIKENKILG